MIPLEEYVFTHIYKYFKLYRDMKTEIIKYKHSNNVIWNDDIRLLCDKSLENDQNIDYSIKLKY